MTRWHVEPFEFETEADPREARGQDADGRCVREHDGRQEFWTGKTWLFFPKEANIYKIPTFTDGYYLNPYSGALHRRKTSVGVVFWQRFELTEDKGQWNTITLYDELEYAEAYGLVRLEIQ